MSSLRDELIEAGARAIYDLGRGAEHVDRSRAVLDAILDKLTDEWSEWIDEAEKQEDGFAALDAHYYTIQSLVAALRVQPGETP